MNIKLLDCTLRDGGYINNWDFTKNQISSTVTNLTNAGVDYIELGYLTTRLTDVKGTQFYSVKSASHFIPKDKKRSQYLIMADVTQFDTDMLCPRSNNTVDGIRVVFYKRQIEQAVIFCKKIVEMGYDLYLQPMVTVDYSAMEFEELVERFYALYHPSAVSVVDSYGCMTQQELFSFINVLDKRLSKEVKIGFHGHDNMQMSLINAMSLFKYPSSREFVLDASVGGLGRGAGNLRMELIVHYVNLVHNGGYNLDHILSVISEVTEPISRIEKWGYSPYFLLTALKRAHPNFATYLLAAQDISVTDFQAFLNLIPDNMLSRCTRPYVEELYEEFLKGR